MSAGQGRCRCGGKKRAVRWQKFDRVRGMYGGWEDITVTLVQVLSRCTRCGKGSR